ncbi:alpha/beta fold hydrolase [Stappia sp. ES.058]|uniref:alpha/beta fold hydrolase n=1 Tax=Stappia sp. ES.058 TaxID=1881061 RepID=UPI00087BC63C|nr:alpha/beta fold hydrolase [Stappia sp. ES.058]SDU48856.1 Serine aminopeptidase, S33 [Stappia sp. ES.058]
MTSSGITSGEKVGKDGALMPLTVAGTFAVLHSAQGAVGVVIAGAWGYEDLCARRSMRHLGDQLAASGYPTLRFDWPGTGDAPEPAAEVDGLANFEATLDAVCAWLRQMPGVEQIVLIGFGLGATLALKSVAEDRQDVAALALLAPVVKGRPYLRELQARAAMIGEITGAAPDCAPGEMLSIGGLGLSERLAADIRVLDVTALAGQSDLPPALVLYRSGKSAEEAFGEALRVRPGGEAHVFAGYDDLMSDPTASICPHPDFDRLVGWLVRTVPPRTSGVAPVLPCPPVLQVAGGASETPLAFGTQGGLIGIWCAPHSPASGALPVVFLNAGATPRAGWARGAAEVARALAARGIPSLRIDLSDIGDSRPQAGGPPIVHYHPAQIADLRAALDLVERQGYGAGAVVTGSCGGAYLALNGAVEEPRVRKVVAVNLQRFLWDPRDDVNEALRFGHTSVGGYGRKMLSVEKWKRVLCGKTNGLALLRSLLRRGFRRTERDLAPWLLGLAPFSRLYAKVHSNLAALRDRGVGVWLVFGDGNSGLAQLPVFFGKDLRRRVAYPNLAIIELSDADHNLTQRGARAELVDLLASAAAEGEVPRQVAE